MDTIPHFTIPQDHINPDNNKAVQVGVVSYKQEQAMIKLELENELLKQQNQKMQEQIVEQKMKSRKVIEKITSPEFKQLSDVQRLANNGNPKAIFLLDQINNYDKRQPSWSTTSLQFCSEWRDASGKGYTHVRTRNFLTCPSRSTLERFAKDEVVKGKLPENVSEVTIEIHPTIDHQ